MQDSPSGEQTDAAALKRTWFRYLWVIGVAVYLFAIWYVGWDKFRASIASLDPFSLLWTALALLCAIWLRVLKWRLALGPGQNATGIFFMSKIGGELTPSRVGELSPLLVRKYRTPQVAAWIVGDRLIEIAGTLAFGAFGAFVLNAERPGYLPAIALAFVVLTVLPIVAVTRRDALRWLAKRTAEGGMVRRSVDFLAESSHEVIQLRGKMPILTLITLLSTGCDILSGVLIYRGFGQPLSFALLSAAQCMHCLVSAVPFLPNVTGAPYVAVGVLLNQVGGVPFEIVAAVVTVHTLIVYTVFWSTFGFIMLCNRGRLVARNDQAALFDRLVERDCLYEYAPEALDAVNALVADKGRVLDVGCGDGTIGAALDGSGVVGFDISARCALLAARRGLHALVADAIRGLPFRDGSFDTVYCVDVLHHLGQAWGPVFEELDRVLAPEGRLIIVEPDARNPLVRWTQAPDSPIRVAPFNNEPAIDPSELLPHLEQRGYACACRSFDLEARQVVRDVFPLWQRLAKAPFVIALAWWCRGRASKFLIEARKPR